MAQRYRGMMMLIGVLAALLTLVPAPSARAQSHYQPGLLDALGRFFQNSTAGIRDAQENVGDIGNQTQDAAKSAAETVARLPSTRIVSGRAKCPMSGNGAPDCGPAAEAICRANNRSSGRSLDIETARDCDVKALISRRREPGDCSTNTYVTRAVCQ